MASLWEIRQLGFCLRPVVAVRATLDAVIAVVVAI